MDEVKRLTRLRTAAYLGEIGVIVKCQTNDIVFDASVYLTLEDRYKISKVLTDRLGDCIDELITKDRKERIEKKDVK